MLRETANALVACVVTFVLCAVAYPAAVWGLGQLAFPKQAEGSLIYDRDRTVIGSELIAQPFASDKYFFSRPSAVDYKADATGGSNLGTKNPDLRKKVIERAEALKATDANPVPVDLVSASGGGMDPHISPEAAEFQAARVAAARSMSVEQVRSLIARHVETSGAIIGAPARVNVLRLNLDLDQEKPEPAATTPAATPTVKPTASLTEEVGTIHDQIVAIAGQVEGLGRQFGALTQDSTTRGEVRASIKAMDDRLAKITEDTRSLPKLNEQVDGLNGRLKSADESVRQLQTELRQARKALETIARPRGGVR